MPYPELTAVLNDIGTEELGHLEMVGTIVYQLTRGLRRKRSTNRVSALILSTTRRGFIRPDANGTPFSASVLAVSGDPVADLTEDLAAEQKARLVYDNILRFCDDPDVKDPIRFLREREIVHFQRFGEALQAAHRPAGVKNVYAFTRRSIRKSASKGEKRFFFERAAFCYIRYGHLSDFAEQDEMEEC